jgi:hypothetical protein
MKSIQRYFRQLILLFLSSVGLSLAQLPEHSFIIGTSPVEVKKTNGIDLTGGLLREGRDNKIRLLIGRSPFASDTMRTFFDPNQFLVNNVPLILVLRRIDGDSIYSFIATQPVQVGIYDKIYTGEAYFDVAKEDISVEYKGIKRVIRYNPRQLNKRK